MSIEDPTDQVAPTSSEPSVDIDLEVSRRRIDELASRLAQTQFLLARARANYVALERSRFSRLRTVWLLVKSILGIGSKRDLFLSTSGTLESRASDSREKHAGTPSVETVRAAFQRRASSAQISEPIVSIVIPAFNHCEVTLRCLFSIAATWFDSLRVEIIVVDDASYDETPQMLRQIPGVMLIRNDKNEGFVESCNRGAEIARGQYLCFLNNDTEVCNGWLDYLVSTLACDDEIGAVGAKLVYPDGRLQESGNIIWRDGTGWNYGRLSDPEEPEFNFARDVDYCSAACLLVRRDAFRAVGGFNKLYAPAYYEDVDLCFALRDIGYRVVVDPRSQVVHFEGVTSGTDAFAGTKRYQEVNRPKFVKRWSGTLRAHLENSPENVYLAARRSIGTRSILVVDSHVPMSDRDAGSDRMLKILQILRDARYRIVFLPDNFARLEPYATQLQAMGIEVLYHAGDFSVSPQDRVRQAAELVDVAWISRPELYRKWAPVVRNCNPAIPLIYDTVDLHHIREKRESDLDPNADQTRWLATEKAELEAARDAQIVVTVTPDESAALQQAGIANVHTVPTIHEPCVSGPTEFAATRGILFIGSYAHPPNVDAARRLIKNIMPVVWQTLPDIRVTLLGANPTAEIEKLRSVNVDVPGYVADIRPYFTQARLFVAPLQFGAGHKGKIGQSLSYCLPVITTSVGAEGYALQSGRDFILAESDEQFAREIVALWGDEHRWRHVAINGLTSIQAFSRNSVSGALLGTIEAAVGQPVSVA